MTDSLNPAQLRRKGYALTILGVLWLSPDSLLLRIIDAPAMDIIGWRAGLSVLVLAAYLLWRDGARALSLMIGQGWRLLLVAAFYGVNSVTFVSAIEHASVADALVIIAATPLLAAALSYFVIGEVLTRRSAVAIFCGAVGIAITAYGGLQGGSAFGMAMAAITAIMLSAQFTMLRAWQDVDPVAAILIGSVVVGALAFIVADPMSIEGTSRIWAIVLGLLLSPIAFTLVSVGPKYIPSAEVSLILLLETVLGPLWVWLVLSEQPAPTALIGGFFVMLGVGIAASSAFENAHA